MRSNDGASKETLGRRMVNLIADQARGEGFSPSQLPGVRFMRSTHYVATSPVMYDPSIVVLAQGRKIGRLGDHSFVYDSRNYLVLAVPLPFYCESFGSAKKPLYGLSIGLSPTLLGELAMQVPARSENLANPVRAADAAPLDESIERAVVQLLETLLSPLDAKILGPHYVREIAYRALCGPLGANLRALASPDTYFGRICRILDWLHSACAQTFDMNRLAREAGMSTTTFHVHFKAVTGSSPLQYLKTIRLQKARLLLVNQRSSVASAAQQVGYESASQFSREFKRYFGGTPLAVAADLRESMLQLA